MKKRVFFMCMLLVLVALPMLAQGADGIGTAADTIKGYIPQIERLMFAIGGVVGLIGGIRVYIKWNNGDQDVNKELMMWGGACVFLIIAPIVIKAFFG